MQDDGPIFNELADEEPVVEKPAEAKLTTYRISLWGAPRSGKTQWLASVKKTSMIGAGPAVAPVDASSSSEKPGLMASLANIFSKAKDIPVTSSTGEIIERKAFVVNTEEQDKEVRKVWDRFGKGVFATGTQEEQPDKLTLDIIERVKKTNKITAQYKVEIDNPAGELFRRHQHLDIYNAYIAHKGDNAAPNDFPVHELYKHMAKADGYILMFDSMDSANNEKLSRELETSLSWIMEFIRLDEELLSKNFNDPTAICKPIILCILKSDVALKSGRLSDLASEEGRQLESSRFKELTKPLTDDISDLIEFENCRICYVSSAGLVNITNDNVSETPWKEADGLQTTIWPNALRGQDGQLRPIRRKINMAVNVTEPIHQIISMLRGDK